MSELNNMLNQNLEQIKQNTKNHNSKLGALSGFVTTMRSDNDEEHKIIKNGQIQIIALLKSIKRTIDFYFIFVVILICFFIAKFTIKSFF